MTLGFPVGADGTLKDSKVKKSSGHADLDEAARSGIFKCKFKPATQAGRSAIQSRMSAKICSRLSSLKFSW